MKGGANLENVLQKWWRKVSTAYMSPHRFHHSIARLAECLELMDEYTYLLSRPQHVELTLWFHNIVHDTAGNSAAPGSAEENAAASSSALSDFITAVDTALQQDYKHAEKECALETLFDEGHPLAEPNERKMIRWITESGQPLQGTSAEADGDFFLDFLLAIDAAGDTLDHEAVLNRLELEICPPLPLGTAEERKQANYALRQQLIEEGLSRRTVYRQEAMVDAYEVQTRANLFSESEVLKFRTWAATHNSTMKSKRAEVDS